MVGVKDTKLEDDSRRVVLVSRDTGAVQELDVDWSQTGRARDLEAIAPGRKRGEYLAVEGSSFGENRARLFELQVSADGGEANKSHQLPDFGQEVEGLVSLANEDGSQTVLFGGRGDENGASRIYWGSLSKEGLKFSPEGLEGKPVEAPYLGEGQRSIADLALDNKGQLWATAAVDEGDQGPFDSMVYRVGHLTEGGPAPFQNSGGGGARIQGTKGEALVAYDGGSFYMGSDNESLGGRLEHFNITGELV